MSWFSSIVAILKSLFSIVDKKTLTEEEKVARIKKEEKKRVKDDWTHTQDEIDRAFDAAQSRSRERMQSD